MRCFLRLLCVLCLCLASHATSFHRVLQGKSGVDVVANVTGRVASRVTQQAVRSASQAAGAVVDELKNRAAAHVHLP